MVFHPGPLARRFLWEESGQDLIEYALLTAIVTVGSLVIIGSIRGRMAAAYAGWGATIQLSWETPPPLGR